MNKQSGELVVVGTDTIDIKLFGNPKRVRFEFEDDIDLVPCEPRDYDQLNYYVHQEVDGHYLLISWDVSDSRELIWEASF